MPLSQFDYILNKLKDYEARLRNIEAFNQVKNLTVKGNLDVTGGGVFRIYDDNEVLILEFDPATGDLEINGDPINTSAEDFGHLSIEHYWTDSASYVDRTGCRFALNGDYFNNRNIYFESIMANEQAARTAYARIYNITDGEALANSEVTTTANPLASLVRVRSSALTIPAGLKEYKLQVRMNQAGGGGDNAHFYAARLVESQA